MPSHLPMPLAVVPADHGIARVAIPYDEAIANAQVMAAAPELLDALRDSQRMLTRAFDRIHTLPRVTDTEIAMRIEKTLVGIKRAILKAEGSAP